MPLHRGDEDVRTKLEEMKGEISITSSGSHLSMTEQDQVHQIEDSTT